MTWKATLALAAVAVGTALIGVWLVLGPVGREEPQVAISLQPDDAALVESGGEIYREHCAACHGAQLEGERNWRQRKANGRLPAPPHDSSGHTWHHGDHMLFTLTKHGPQALAGADYQSDMPAYDGILSDREIIAVLSFIKSRWPAEVQAQHDRITEAQRPNS